MSLTEGLRGTGLLDGELTPVGRATVGGALARIERELFEADGRRLGPSTVTRPRPPTSPHPAQRRHDALVEMATRAMSARRGGTRPRR